MKQDVKVMFYLKKNEVKDGGCPVMARLTVGSTESVFSAKLTAPADLWASGRAKGKGATATEINRRLDELRAAALAHYRELSAMRTRVTADEVKTMLLGMAFGQETLLAYFRAHNEKFDKRVGVNRSKCTAGSYWNTLNHLTKFLVEKYHLTDIPFTALDRSFIDKFDLHLRTECRLAPGTIVLLTVRLGTIINHAIAEGIITADPFAGYEAERPERKPKFLNDAEVKRLMTTPLASPKHYLIRDLFLFSCETGIPYGDMRRLARGAWRCPCSERQVVKAAARDEKTESRRGQTCSPLPPLRSPSLHPQPSQTSNREDGEIADVLRDYGKHFEIDELLPITVLLKNAVLSSIKPTARHCRKR